MSSDWFTKVSLPDIPEWGLPGSLTDAFDEVTTNRKAVAFVCEKGNGKTDTVLGLVDQYNAVQDHREAQAPETYERLRVVLLSTLRSAAYRESILHLYTTLKGTEVRTRVGQRRKSDDELREELVHALHRSRVVALLVDEAELCSKAMLDLLRDVHADAERLDPRRAVAGGRITLGIGILLLGAPKLTAILAAHEEAGQRWSALVAHRPVAASMVPQIYRTWFPGFEPAIQVMGETAWRNLIASVVTLGKPVSLRRLESHARRYLRRVARAHPAIQSREAVPFIVAVFRDALDDEFPGNGPAKAPTTGAA